MYAVNVTLHLSKTYLGLDLNVDIGSAAACSSELTRLLTKAQSRDITWRDVGFGRESLLLMVKAMSTRSRCLHVNPRQFVPRSYAALTGALTVCVIGCIIWAIIGESHTKHAVI
jgi:hypothetical protein